MARALEKPPNLAVLARHPRLELSANGYKYLIEYKDGAAAYTVSDGHDSRTWPIHYAFGMNSQTFVLENDGHFNESLVSYYPTVGGLAITMGSEGVQPHTIVEAMGRVLGDADARGCFGCHTSGSESGGQLHAATARPGLDCEHCHTGAGVHLEAMRNGKPGPVPQKLGELGAEDMSNFCGQCHRSWETVLRNRWFGAINVRFQPYRLANSRCFIGNDRRIRCTACHNPHQDLVRDDGSYDRACLACHAAVSTPHLEKVSTAGGAPAPKTCPVAQNKCVSCHMPKVELPGSHVLFTDHFIRVVRKGETYPE